MNTNAKAVVMVVAGIGALALGSTVTARGSESPILMFSTTEPLIDISKNPGCGVKLTSSEEKRQRNVRIVQLYFQSYGAGDPLRYSLQSHHCFAEKYKFLMGNSMPPPSAPIEIQQQPGAPDLGKAELKAYQSVFPDIGTVPGSLKVIPWDDGVNYSFKYGAHHKQTGEYIELWETGTLLINDEGKITYFELWNESNALNRESELVLGKRYDQMSPAEYGRRLQEKVKELEK